MKSEADESGPRRLLRASIMLFSFVAASGWIAHRYTAIDSLFIKTIISKEYACIDSKVTNATGPLNKPAQTDVIFLEFDKVFEYVEHSLLKLTNFVK